MAEDKMSALCTLASARDQGIVRSTNNCSAECTCKRLRGQRLRSAHQRCLRGGSVASWSDPAYAPRRRRWSGLV